MHHLDLDAITLDRGGHRRPDDGLCVMEAVAYFAAEKHSDYPECVSPVIGAFLRRWNDDLDDEGRQKLKRLIPLVVGTNTGKADDETRAWLVTDWMVRTYLPAWLDLGGMGEQAAAVRALDPIISATAWRQGSPAVDGARRAAAAAWDAAWDAARDAAWAAARAAAGAAAGAAARDAARAAAWDAAWDVLRPTVEELQRSALGLLDRMIAVGSTPRTETPE